MKNKRFQSFLPIVAAIAILLNIIPARGFQTSPASQSNSANGSETNGNSTNSAIQSNSAVSTQESAQSNRTIVATSSDIVEDDSCTECLNPLVATSSGVSPYLLFALASPIIPIVLLARSSNNDPAPAGPTATISNSTP